LFVMVWPQRKEREGLKRTLAKETLSKSIHNAHQSKKTKI
jgi:hypothetical protein